MTSVRISVDIDDIIDEIDTDDLVEELKARASYDKKAAAVVGVPVVEGIDKEDLRLARLALADGDAEAFMRLVGPTLRDADSDQRAAAVYAKLERDAVTGRPVIQ